MNQLVHGCTSGTYLEWLNTLLYCVFLWCRDSTFGSNSMISLLSSLLNVINISICLRKKYIIFIILVLQAEDTLIQILFLPQLPI